MTYALAMVLDHASRENINIINLANNHSLQHGVGAVFDTVDMLRCVNILIRNDAM
jgi:hypothetical protein